MLDVRLERAQMRPPAPSGCKQVRLGPERLGEGLRSCRPEHGLDGAAHSLGADRVPDEELLDGLQVVGALLGQAQGQSLLGADQTAAGEQLGGSGGPDELDEPSAAAPAAADAHLRVDKANSGVTCRFGGCMSCGKSRFVQMSPVQWPQDHRPANLAPNRPQLTRHEPHVGR